MQDWLHTDPALAADALGLHRSAARWTPPTTTRYEAVPVGSQEIESLEHSVEVFRAWDAAARRRTPAQGGRRPAQRGVGGMLATTRHPAPAAAAVGRGGQPRGPGGWMSHDIGLEPTAQKYFLIAAHAAREGGDRPRAARRSPGRPGR